MRRAVAVPADARANGDPGPESTSSREARQWMQAHAGFLRAVLFVLAYCSAVISMISVIAFRGVHAVAIVTGALFIIAVIAVFLLPRACASSR
jgi:hypothetical protein